MKIYKGTQSKSYDDVLDDPDSLVYTIDLSDDFEAWEYEKIIKVNATIKQDPKRKSVAYIQLTEADIIALHQGLLLSLRERASKKNDLETALKQIKKVTFSLLLSISTFNKSDSNKSKQDITSLRNRIEQINKLLNLQ
jgi:cob(I)alamin adenosyltransferase